MRKRETILRACGAGLERCCGKAKFSFACQKRTRKAPATFEAREARERGCSPLSDPEGVVETEKSWPLRLTLFSRFSDLLLRSWCYVFAGREVQQKGEIFGGAVNGRSTKNAQQRRPPPAADTGRSCWGRGQQDTSAAQGTKWTLGTATRLSEAASIFGLRLPLWNR